MKPTPEQRARMTETFENVDILQPGEKVPQQSQFHGFQTIHSVTSTGRSGLMSTIEYDSVREGIQRFEAEKDRVDSGELISVSYVGKDSRGKPIDMSYAG